MSTAAVAYIALLASLLPWFLGGTATGAAGAGFILNSVSDTRKGGKERLGRIQRNENTAYTTYLAEETQVLCVADVEDDRAVARLVLLVHHLVKAAVELRLYLAD